MWTVDRERESYLIEVRNGQGGQPEYSSQASFAFYFRGSLYTVVLRGSAKTVGDRKWIKSWELEKVYSKGVVSIKNEELLSVLRESLKVCGYDGARKQIDGYSIECDF